jgi:hypothetical protein
MLDRSTGIETGGRDAAALKRLEGWPTVMGHKTPRAPSWLQNTAISSRPAARFVDDVTISARCE